MQNYKKTLLISLNLLSALWVSFELFAYIPNDPRISASAMDWDRVVL